MSLFRCSIIQEILFCPDRLYRWPYVRFPYRLHDRERPHIVCVMVVPLQNNNKRKIIVNMKDLTPSSSFSSIPIDLLRNNVPCLCSTQRLYHSATDYGRVKVYYATK